MATYDTVKEEYNTHGSSYNHIQSVPYGKLESQLFDAALGNAVGATILDLGGGTGLKAHQALDAGAESVDIVDISSEMMSEGKELAKKLGHDQIRWFEADASQPLDHLDLKKQYDIVTANWLFDHATSLEALEGMWRNIASYLKPGGRFVGVRSGDPKAPAMLTGKYGIGYKDIEDIPGGVKLRYWADLDPPIDFEATLMESSYSGSTEMHEKFGFEDIQLVPYDNIPIIKADPSYWQMFLDDPSVAAVTAKKRVD